MGWILQLGAFIACLFAGFALYEKLDELQWCLPVWLMSLWFAWNVWEDYLRELTPWRR